jgi:hypothetical protein
MVELLARSQADLVGLLASMPGTTRRSPALRPHRSSPRRPRSRGDSWRAKARINLPVLILFAAAVVSVLILDSGAGNQPRALAPTHPLPSIAPTDPASAPPTTDTSTRTGTGTGTLSPTVPTTVRTMAPPVPTTGSGRGPNPSPTTNPAGPGPTLRAAPVIPTPARMSFEDDTDTWGPFWNGSQVSITTTTAVAYDGTHALWLHATPVHGQNTAVGTTHIDGLHAGMTVTLHVWYGGQGDGKVSPFIQAADDTPIFPPTSITLPRATGWTSLTFTIPATVTPKGIGVQLDVNNGIDLDIAVDSVSW